MTELLKPKLSDMQLWAKLEEMVLSHTVGLTGRTISTAVNDGHHFHKAKQGLRFTVSKATRLLKLNHECYAEKIAQGLHEKKGAKVGRKRCPAAPPADLFGDIEEAS